MPGNSKLQMAFPKLNVRKTKHLLVDVLFTIPSPLILKVHTGLRIPLLFFLLPKKAVLLWNTNNNNDDDKNYNNDKQAKKKEERLNK